MWVNKQVFAQMLLYFLKSIPYFQPIGILLIFRQLFKMRICIPHHFLKDAWTRSKAYIKIFFVDFSQQGWLPNPLTPVKQILLNGNLLSTIVIVSTSFYVFICINQLCKFPIFTIHSDINVHLMMPILSITKRLPSLIFPFAIVLI